MRRKLTALLGIGLAITLGCGGPQRGTVTGVVQIGGQPLTNALVVLLGSDKMTYRGDTDAAGRFTIDGVPYGALKVSVQKHLEKPASKSQYGSVKKEVSEAEREDNSKIGRNRAPAEPPAAPAAGRTVPARYADPNQSGLDFELNSPALDRTISLDLN